MNSSSRVFYAMLCMQWNLCFFIRNCITSIIYQIDFVIEYQHRWFLFIAFLGLCSRILKVAGSTEPLFTPRRPPIFNDLIFLKIKINPGFCSVGMKIKTKHQEASSNIEPELKEHKLYLWVNPSYFNPLFLWLSLHILFVRYLLLLFLSCKFNC